MEERLCNHLNLSLFQKLNSLQNIAKHVNYKAFLEESTMKFEAKVQHVY